MFSEVMFIEQKLINRFRMAQTKSVERHLRHFFQHD